MSLADRTPDWRIYRRGSNEALTFFSRLALGRCEELEAGEDSELMFKEMFNLVDRTATRLEQLNLKRVDVLSLVGRALFFRFLRDREVITEDDHQKIAPRAGSLLACLL